MSKNFPEIAEAVVENAGLMRDAAPDAMKAFGQLGKAAYADGAWSAAQKEVIALVIGVISHCDGCVAYHAKAAREKGATRAEVAEALAVAVQMGGGPSMVYAGDALRAYDSFA